VDSEANKALVRRLYEEVWARVSVPGGDDLADQLGQAACNPGYGRLIQ
jgi:hypothetical protein